MFTTPILVDDELKSFLIKAKIIPRETFNAALKRLLKKEMEDIQKQK